MTTTATPTQPLRGGLCPPWCSHHENADDLREILGGIHHLHTVDTFTVERGRQPIAVTVRGFRLDGNADDDWSGSVEVTGEACPGFMDGVDLPAAEARRLAEAVLRGCELLEADQ